MSLHRTQQAAIRRLDRKEFWWAMLGVFGLLKPRVGVVAGAPHSPAPNQENRGMAQLRNVRLQSLQHEVASAALTGVPAKEIDERVIDPSRITDEEKAALRLFAWSFVSRFELRRMALDELHRLGRVHDHEVPPAPAPDPVRVGSTSPG